MLRSSFQKLKLKQQNAMPPFQFASIVYRLFTPAFFRYDFTSARTQLSLKANRIWLTAWLLADIGAERLLAYASGLQASFDWYGLFSWGVYSLTFFLAWKLLSPLLSSALAGLGLFRALASIGLVGAAGGFGSELFIAQSWIGNFLLIVQVWMLAAGVWLLLQYVRTPKRDMPLVTGLEQA